jgi:hypothetical protein
LQKTLSLTVLCLIASIAPSSALLVTVSRYDLERALAIARWPTTDRERARFQEAYTFPVDGRPVGYAVLSGIEVITEFRRVELLAEAHMRANDLWGRGGIQDVEDAIKPFRGRLTLVAHVRFLPTTAFITGVPPIDVVVQGKSPKVLGIVRNGVYSSSGSPGEGAALVGADIEQMLDARSVGQLARNVCVVWGTRRLGCTVIDFGALQ